MKLISCLTVLAIIFNFSLSASHYGSCSHSHHYSDCEEHGESGVMTCCSPDGESGSAQEDREEDQGKSYFGPILFHNPFDPSCNHFVPTVMIFIASWSPPPPLDKIKMLC